MELTVWARREECGSVCWIEWSGGEGGWNLSMISVRSVDVDGS